MKHVQSSKTMHVSYDWPYFAVSTFAENYSYHGARGALHRKGYRGVQIPILCSSINKRSFTLLNFILVWICDNKKLAEHVVGNSFRAFYRDFILGNTLESSSIISFHAVGLYTQ